MYDWILDQQNRILFVMVDNAGAEVAGLGGGGLTLELSKDGGAFVGSAGTKAEVSDGWYSYLGTAGEADTIGPVAITANGAGCVQQNLEYIVLQRVSQGIEFTYTLTDSVTGLPLNGARVQFATDAAMADIVWVGVTDAFGVARDADTNLPHLDAGTYYVRSRLSGYQFTIDTEVVS